MEIKIELDLPGIIAAACTAERIQPLVDKAIAEALKDAIRDATDYRSPFREELKRQLSEAMPHGLSINDVARFQQMLNVAVVESVQGCNAQTIQVAMQQAVKTVIPDVPARVKLSEVVEAARAGLHKEEHEGFYARLEIDDHGWGALYLDRDESCRGIHYASTRIAFDKEGEVYAMRIDGTNITPKSVPQAISRFSGLLLSMYVGRTAIDVDCDADDVEAAAAEQFD